MNHHQSESEIPARTYTAVSCAHIRLAFDIVPFQWGCDVLEATVLSTGVDQTEPPILTRHIIQLHFGSSVNSGQRSREIHILDNHVLD